jgi:hypothetical protein
MVSTPVGSIPRLKTRLTWEDHWGSLRVRLGIKRDRYRIEPGLYAIGTPDRESPVLVSANYKLSLDALRKELASLDAWILVIDSKGINVWCAAGKGSFGNAEIERRINASRLSLIVDHRELILPQLAGPGVSAWRLAKECGWKARFGPVRAKDLPAWLRAGKQAEPGMRQVHFGLRDRLVLIPLDISMAAPKALLLFPLVLAIALAGSFLGSLTGISSFSLGAALRMALWVWGSAFGAFLVGSGLVPLLLPWLPVRSFALKGWLVGLAYAFLLVMAGRSSPVESAAFLVALPALAAQTALAFTGSTTFTSLSGVEKEVVATRRLLPILMGLASVLELPVLAGWLR